MSASSSFSAAKPPVINELWQQFLARGRIRVDSLSAQVRAQVCGVLPGVRVQEERGRGALLIPPPQWPRVRSRLAHTSAPTCAPTRVRVMQTARHPRDSCARSQFASGTDGGGSSAASSSGASDAAGLPPPDVVYARVLKALSRVPPADAALLVDWLTDWRNGFTRSSSTAALRRQLAVEVVFLEALAKVVAGSGLRPSGGQFQRLQGIAFEWLLEPSSLLPGGGRDFDARGQQPELRRLHEQVSALASQLLGVLSAGNLEAIQARYLSEVKARLGKDCAGPERQQLLALCAGMRSVRLGFADTRQVRVCVCGVFCVDAGVWM